MQNVYVLKLRRQTRYIQRNLASTFSLQLPHCFLNCTTGNHIFLLIFFFFNFQILVLLSLFFSEWYILYLPVSTLLFCPEDHATIVYRDTLHSFNSCGYSICYSSNSVLTTAGLFLPFAITNTAIINSLTCVSFLVFVLR